MNTSIILGIAGHIDHGKTSLIKALNGFDGDTTQEEKSRGITLDLSFSHLQFEDHHISLIDVPGHHKLVKHMIAGAFGFDYLLLVIDPKEGIMPQTLEHVQIASFLGVHDMICVFSKKDQYTTDQKNQCEQQIRKLASLYSINLIALAETSIYIPSSIKNLKAILQTLSPKSPKTSVFRYYIDRSFLIAGAGCVVSGTILGGSVQIKESLKCFDIDQNVKVKGIKIHHQSVEYAQAPTRAALNLTGIKHTALKRGYILSKKGYLRGFKSIDAWIESYHRLPKHNQWISLYIGSRKVEVKILYLQNPEPISDHKKGLFVTLQAQEALFAIFNECFILKDEEGVLAGGQILNPIADPMNKHQKLKLLQALKAKELSKAFTILLQAHKKGFGIIASFQRFALSQTESLEILKHIPDIFIDEKELIAYPITQISILKQDILRIFKKNPNALLSAHSLHYRFLWASEACLTYALEELAKEQQIKLQEGLYLSIHSTIDDTKHHIQTILYEQIQASGYAPQAPSNLYESLDIDHISGDLCMQALCKAKKIIRINNKLFIAPEHLSGILSQLRTIIEQKGYVDVNNAKTLGLSRKYLIAYLEQLDDFSDIINLNQKRYLKNTNKA